MKDRSSDRNWGRSCAYCLAFVGVITLSVSTIGRADGLPNEQAAASAPSSDTISGALEEITVTAQRRAERLQDTPISITAFTAAAIDALGVTNVAQLSNLAPNVRFDFTAPVSGASDAAGIFIRGVGQADFALTTEAGVGTYVDGVYMSRSIGGVLDVLDVDHMEILRGPQGTLFGRNTIGGAISIVSAKPTDEFSGTGELEVGSFNRRDIRAMLNIPVSDMLKVRLTASSKEEDGYVHSLLVPSSPAAAVVPNNASIPGSGSQIDYGNENRQAARLLAEYDPHSNFTAELSVDSERVRENNAPSVLAGVSGGNNPALGPIVFVYNLVQAPGTTIPGFANAQYSCANFCTGKNSTYATGPNGTSINAWGTALTLSWHPVLTLEVKSISAYHEEEGFFNRDADESPIDLTQTSNYDYQHRQFSQELQFNGNEFDDRLKYASGLYYFVETGSDPLLVTFPSSIIQALDQVEDRVDNKSFAVYAQGTFSLTQQLSITAGGRYTRDTKTFDTDQYLITGTSQLADNILFGGAPPGTLINLVPPNSHVSSTFNNRAPRVSVDYKLTKDILTYVSYNEGYKGGGFNLRYVAPVQAVVPFAPEKLRTWEAGLKSEFFNSHVRANFAVFTSYYSDMQLTEYQELGAPLTVNEGNSRIRGGELELVAAPLEGLELSYSLGILSAHYVSLLPNPALNLPPEVQITLNSKLQKTPPNESILGVDYRLAQLLQNGSIMLHADWRFTADTFNDAQNSIYLYQRAYNIGNASIGWQPSSGKWSLRVFGNNMTNQRYIVSGDSNYGIGFHEAEYNRPREWGVAGKVSF
jgi:iron complex outermembrane receptor protein